MIATILVRRPRLALAGYVESFEAEGMLRKTDSGCFMLANVRRRYRQELCGTSWLPSVRVALTPGAKNTRCHRSQVNNRCRRTD